MNDHTITLVRESFDLLEPISAQVGTAFYANLIRTDPALEHLLRVDMDAEAAKLMRVVSTVVEQLDHPDALTPLLHALGRKLATHGFKDVNYPTFFNALLQTLHEKLGAAYTEEVEQAWQSIYGAVTSTMKEGAAVPA